MFEIYVREGFLYTEEQLFKELRYSSSQKREFNKLIELLKNKKILRTRRKRGSKEKYDDDASLISEYDVDYEDYVGEEHGEKQYLFRFVGVFYYANRVVYVYPKYIKSSIAPKVEMKQVLKVLRKYQGKKLMLGVPEFVESLDGGSDLSELSVLLFLLNDYVDNGIYSEDERIIELNGEGSINWNLTVSQIDPLIIDNKPIYFDVYTDKKIDNEKNYCTRLHRYILSVSTYEMAEIGLSSIFGLPLLDLTEDDRDFFGDTENILEKIDSEIRTQFDDRKKAILKALELYVKIRDEKENIKAQKGEDALDFFGTRSFHVVWEEIINEIYVSQKKITLEEIRNNYVSSLDYCACMPNGSVIYIEKETALDEIIDKPAWNIKNKISGKEETYWPSRTFIPDYLRFTDDGKEFYILDAKYYVPQYLKKAKTDNVIIHQPGVQDIAKQYIYYMAYQRLLRGNGIDVGHVKNYFVMPTEDESFELGNVEIDFFKDFIPNVFNIRIKMLNVSQLYNDYLGGCKHNVEELANLK